MFRFGTRRSGSCRVSREARELLRIPLAHLRDALGRDPTVTGALVLLGGSIGAHAITLALMPVLTRVATPAEFGGLARFISMVGVLLAIVSLRYEWAVPLASSEARSARLIQLSMLLVLGFAGLAAIAAAAVGPSGPVGPIDHLGIEGRHVAAWVAPGIVVLGTVQILTSWTIRTGSFRLLAMSRVLHSSFVGMGQVVLCALFGGHLALIIGFLGGQMLAYAQLARRAFGEVVRNARAEDPPGLANVAREYRRFPLLSAPSSLVNALGVEAPILLISSLGGAQPAGQLALTQRWAALPGMLVMQSSGAGFLHGGRSARDDGRSFAEKEIPARHAAVERHRRCGIRGASRGAAVLSRSVRRAVACRRLDGVLAGGDDVLADVVRNGVVSRVPEPPGAQPGLERRPVDGRVGRHRCPAHARCVRCGHGCRILLCQCHLVSGSLPDERIWPVPSYRPTGD